jgi:PHD/YefM family antitoxin component YafN of YafNO toxin-antitoxin module
MSERTTLPGRAVEDAAGAAVQYVTNEAGETTAVLIPIAEYEALMEDLEDLAVVAERRDEPTSPHREVVDELRRDGKL